jgi:hypothetical protein
MLLGYVICRNYFPLEENYAVFFYSYSLLFSCFGVLKYLIFFFIIRSTIDMIVAVFTAYNTRKFLVIFMVFLVSFTLTQMSFTTKALVLKSHE